MGIAGGEVVTVAELVAYQSGSVVSRQLAKNGSGSVTVFAFDEGEGLSEHTTPHDALVWILDGAARITVGGATHTVGAGQVILLPGGEPHAVAAPQRFTMVLTMLKNQNEASS
jgi:quercetin dioxygenase-like cupin family protein